MTRMKRVTRVGGKLKSAKRLVIGSELIFRKQESGSSGNKRHDSDAKHGKLCKTTDR
jgi:hypothetical protein